MGEDLFTCECCEATSDSIGAYCQDCSELCCHDCIDNDGKCDDCNGNSANNIRKRQKQRKELRASMIIDIAKKFYLSTDTAMKILDFIMKLYRTNI
jgi:hypothetical protein